MDILKMVKGAANTVWFEAKKRSPEILLGLGTAGIIGTIFLSNKETSAAKEVIERHKEGREEIITASQYPEEYSHQDMIRDKFNLYKNTGVDLLKVYWPSITLGVASFGCIFASYGIMKGRNAAILAAYNAVNKAYDSYRERVRTEIGDEAEEDIHYGRRTEKIETVKKKDDGKEVKSKEKIKVFTDANGHSIYSVFFDESSTRWQKDPILNKDAIIEIERDLTDKLRGRGWLSISEAYDALGFDIDASDPRLPEMQLLGWRSEKYGGKGRVDFGIMDGYRQENVDFVNGRSRYILLDMNIDGYIYDNTRAITRSRA